MITSIGTPKYGALLARARPKVIQTDEEFERSVAMLEKLDLRAEAGEILSGEEMENSNCRRHPGSMCCAI